MIKTKKGYVELDGSVHEILTDVSIVITSVGKMLTEKVGMDNTLAEELINEAVELGMANEEELKKKFEEKLETESTDLLIKLLKEVLKHE